MAPLGTSGGFWIWAVVLGIGMLAIFGGIVYFVMRKGKSD